MILELEVSHSPNPLARVSRRAKRTLLGMIVVESEILLAVEEP